MFDLESDPPDDTLVEMVRLPTRIRNAVKFAGLKTIGDLRETTDEMFAKAVPARFESAGFPKG